MPRYKAGQIITLTNKNYKLVCRVRKDGSIYSCYNCDMYKALKYLDREPRTKLCWRNFKLRNQPFDCGPNLGLYLNLKVIKYVKI